MTPSNLDKLAKILALVDSSHDGEAAAAMRMARQLLAQDGLGFADLVRRAVGNQAASASPPPPIPPPDNVRTVRFLEAQLVDLRVRLRQHHTTADVQNKELARSRLAIAQLESALGKSKTEVDKWRRLASDTADRLWEIGQQIQQNQVLARGVVTQMQQGQSDKRPLTTRHVPPPGFSRQRRFVRNSLLEAQEIDSAATKV